MNKKQLIKKHCEERSIYEEQARTIIDKWVTTYYPTKKPTITFTTEEWNHTDFYFNGKSPSELKIRWIQDMTQYNKYKEQGFVLSTKKLDYNDYFFYYIPLTKEMMYITKTQILNGLDNGYITTTTKNVNKYQFATELGKKQEELLLIPYDCFTIYPL